MDGRPKGKPGESGMSDGDWIIEFNNPSATQISSGGLADQRTMIGVAGPKAADQHGATVALDVHEIDVMQNMQPLAPPDGGADKTQIGGPALSGAPPPPPGAAPRQRRRRTRSRAAAPRSSTAPQRGVTPIGKEDDFEEIDFTPGKMVFKYELVRCLGQGGMGQVWAAHDTRLGRRVAIKFLLSKASKNKEFRERFLAEARATAQFNHENIVTIHDAGEFHGNSYLVLEYLEGEPLSSRIRQRRIPWAQAVQIMIPIARALGEAHARGIGHRDLKPANIVMLKNGGLKILDFGLAKLFDTEASTDAEMPNKLEMLKKQREEMAEDSDVSGLSGVSGMSGRKFLHDGDVELTRAGTIMGTYAYMSPEQWGLGRVDYLSDLWAAGVIFFQMIAGEHPFGAATTEVIMANIGKLNEPVRSVREVVPTVPEEVAQIISACLQKKKKHRIQDASELVERLQAMAGQGGGAAARLKEGQNPYPGLAPFTERDANRFFGRDEEIAKFIAKLKERPTLAVVGPSGAGKSSFIRAGVISTLRQNSSNEWDVIIMRPGRDPFAALAGALLMEQTSDIVSAESVLKSAQEESTLTEQLLTEPGRLGALLRARARSHGRPVMVYLDQFEELYTLVEDPALRERFATAIASVAVDASSPVRVVLSMRSDFLDRVAENQLLMDAITRDLTLLNQPGSHGLREAVLKPALLAGFSFDDESLVDEMVASLEGETAALPLLQFAAQKLWEARDRERKLLTRAAYEQMGGVEGALVRHADAVIKAMPTQDRMATRTLFQRLVTPDGTREILSLGEIRSLFDKPSVAERILRTLTEARLLVIQTIGEEAEEARVEIVHESLITRWGMLKRWLEETQEDSAMLQQLRDASKQWDSRGRPAGLLWTGDALDEARLWRKKSQAVLTPVEDAFLRAAFRQAERVSRRKKLLTYGAVAIMGAVTVVVLFLAIRAISAEKDAKRAERQARKAAVEAKRQAARARKAEADIKKQNLQLAKETAKAKAATQLATKRSEELEKQGRELAKEKARAERAYRRAAAERDIARRERRRARRAAQRARRAAALARQQKEKADRANSKLKTAQAELAKLFERQKRELARLRALRSRVIQRLPD